MRTLVLLLTSATLGAFLFEVAGWWALAAVPAVSLVVAAAFSVVWPR